LLRKKGFFKEEDFHVLSKIVLKITLPAAIVANFSGVDLQASLLILSVLGLGGGLMLITSAYLAAGKNREEKAFFMLNTSGYNIGNFTMPFAQSFLGPAGVITTSLFDTGNSFICLGGAFSAAKMVKEGEGKISLIPIIKTLVRSVPFDAYITMTALSLLRLILPAPVITFSEVVSGANAFIAMLMMGVGFKTPEIPARRKIKDPAVRYGVSIAVAAALIFMPLPLEYRQALAILPCPIGVCSAGFTADLKGRL
ncbi:MAG: AEC family transporter, partial [Clostridium sp.]